MKKKTRDKLSIGIKIGAIVLAAVVLLGYILQAFMW